MARRTSKQSLWHYITRIIPILSLCCLACLLIFVLIVEPYYKAQDLSRDDDTTIWQWLLSVEIAILSAMTIAFPLRAFFALGNVLRQMRLSTAQTHSKSRCRRKINGHPRPTTINPTRRALFAIIIPSYREEIRTLEETLLVLAAHPRALYDYHVYLAMEERENGAANKAKQLLALFRQKFYRLDYCVHPQGVAGEAPGKSSNESWAARQISKDYFDEPKEDIIVTTIDADTHLSPRYFSQITDHHFGHPYSQQRTIYMPPLVFDRNIHEVPFIVKTADIIWAGAGISSMYPGSSVCIPTSVYSLPLILVEHVGGWDTDSGAIGEDMHMYLKCFFALSGHLATEVIFAPASQCNVGGADMGIRGYFNCVGARYRQALRHMWGALDTGFTIRQAINMIQKCYGPPLMKKIPHGDSPVAFLNGEVHWSNFATLAYRIFEAHFLPTHVALAMATTSYYNVAHSRFFIPVVLRAALDFSSWCRALAFCMMIFYLYRYNQYYRLCIGLRGEGTGVRVNFKSGKKRIPNLNMRLPVGILEAVLFPLGGLLFGSIPALQATISHIFTERLTYVVSLKSVHSLQRPGRECE